MTNQFTQGQTVDAAVFLIAYTIVIIILFTTTFLVIYKAGKGR